MNTFLTYTILGLVVSCLYALSATGLVVTYTASGVFNFAHGAIGMIAAFCYWQLAVHWGVPAPLAFLIVVFVGAPLLGVGVERIFMRRLQGVGLEGQLATTLGLMLLLIGVANLAWNPANTSRTLLPFWNGHAVKLFHIFVSFHEIAVVVIALAVAVGLRLFFGRSRMGVAMRAVVDNSDLAAMAGARPYRVAMLSWALGAGLAALAGVLLAPLQYLDIFVLTLLIINAFAAAVVGRLKNLAATVIGAFLLGMSITYAVGYLPVGSALTKIQEALPMVLLFLVLVVMRQERLRAGRTVGLQIPAVPTLRASLASAGLFVVVAFLISAHLSPINLVTGGRALVLGLALLSLVLLTGYGGQVSLAQMSFVGVGAWVMGHVGGHSGSLLGVVLAVLVAAGFGAAVSLPTLRLRGLYLALATLAFAYAMDYIFFGQVFGQYGGSLPVARFRIPGVPTTSDRAFFVSLAVIFAAAGVGVLAVRRSRFGRRLAALNDSPQACATLGVNINYTKLAVFTASAGLAGLSGAMYGGLQHIVSANDFLTQLSLVLILLLLIGGRNTVSGALIGATFFAVFPVIQQHVHALANIQYLLTGLGALGVSRRPNGLGGDLARAGERMRALVAGRRARPEGPPALDRRESAEEPTLVGARG